jgi:predicted Zn-dependent protease
MTMKIRNQKAILCALGGVVVSAGLLIAGCGGPGGDLVQSMAGSIPGMNNSNTQRALDLTAKGIDRADLESPQRQDTIGQSVAIGITNRYPLIMNEELNDYVSLVGLTVASVSRNPDLSYTFGVLDSSDVAAYSTPGGYIFISRGALALVEDESELAGVLAHEVAHVALHHGMDAVKSSSNMQVFSSAIQAGSNQAAQFGQFIDGALDIAISKPYSRGQESGADAEAVKYLKASGYDPKGLLRFLQKLQSQSGASGGLMSTHPGTADRIAAVQRAAGNATGVTLKERYAANVR